MIPLKTLISEDYPSNFSMDKFNSISSYAGKIKYAQSLLKRISSGSSRIVYLIDDTKVLKLAKNKKGVAQNTVESDWSMRQYDIVAKVFDLDEKNNYWIEMEFARKVSPKKFKEFTGFTIDKFAYLIRYLDARLGNGKMFELSPEIKQKLEENDFYFQLEDFVSTYDINPNDFNKLSSFGEVTRDGEQKIVIIDYGLTRDVYNNNYK